MGNKSKVKKAGGVKIVATWDGVEGENQEFNLSFTPDPLNTKTDIRKHLVVLANAFAAGTNQLMSVIKQLPQPTEEELKNYTYDFAEHGKEYGEGLFALYNYKKALMEEFVSIVEKVLPDAFHDVLFVKGTQEKIFEQLRKEHLAKKVQEDALKAQEDTLKVEEATTKEDKKGMVN